MSTPLSVEIFIIGNEILIGDIQDTNTNWLCREIDRIGGRVERAVVLRDEEQVIADELKAALARGADVIITSGGLGPTADDLSLAAVARGAGLPLLLHQQALRMIRQRYDELTAQGVLSLGGLNPAREKMAWLPEGALPLHNPVGTAPAVLLSVGQTCIISLPGVPSELKGIFNSSLQPFLLETFRGGSSLHRTITVASNDESIMEPVLSRVVNHHPSIYIKSLARTLGESQEIDITLTSVGDDPPALKDLLKAALRELQQGLDELAISHREKQDHGAI
ncbi:MAG: competence/damage-inducible protein A [Steroidobacteraceae bacterium]|nr:competence/damage-inducible protein A [Deltaproteobacteria bacterium]